MSRAKIQQAIDTIYAKIFNEGQGHLLRWPTSPENTRINSGSNDRSNDCG